MGTIQRVLEEYDAGFTPVHTLLLDLHGVKIQVNTDSDEVARLLSRYYTDYLVEGPAGQGDGDPQYRVDAYQQWIKVDPDELAIYVEKGKTKPKEAFLDDSESGLRLMLKVRSGVLALLGRGHIRVAGDLAGYVNQLNNIINAVFIIDRMDAGYTLFHASALACGDRGVIVSGRSGAGKSSAAIWTLDHGISIISNDRLLARRPAGAGPADIPMLGVPKKPRINPGTIVGNPKLHGMMPADELARFQAMPMEELWHVEQKYDLDVKTVFGPEAEKATAMLHAAFFIDWTVGGGDYHCNLLPAERYPEFYGAVFKDGGVFDLKNTETSLKSEHEAEYERVLEGIPVYHVTGGVSFEALVQSILDCARS